MHLFLSRDWKPSANLISYRHDIEASWLLQEAAEVLGNKNLLEEVKLVILNMAEATAAAFLPDGSLYHELDVDASHHDKHREWWVSAEAMVGFLNAYQLTSKQSFLEHSINSWSLIKNHLLDIKGGE